MPSKFNPTPKDCLSYEQVANELRYDPETGHLFWIKRGPRRNLVNPAGCLNHDGHKKVGVLGVICQAHRLAWLLHHKKWPYAYLDHINGNRGDNRISNLREVSIAQNMQNKEVKKKGKALPGTYYRSKKGKYEANIWINRKRIWLGIYDTEISAHKAYLEGVKKYHTNDRHISAFNSSKN